jgi:two-component system, NtrC family, sensor kinase
MDLGQVAQGADPTLLLDLLLQASHDGIMRLDLETGAAHYTPRWYCLFGYESEDDSALQNRGTLWRDLVHEADRPEMDELLRDHIERAWPFSTTVRMAHRHGGFRHVLCRATTQRNAEGKASHVVMLFSDITDRIRLEERQAAIARALPDTLILVDSKQTIVEVLPGIERPGSPLTSLAVGQQLPPYLAETPIGEQLQRLAGDGPRQSRGVSPPAVQIATRTADGTLIHHELRVFPLGDHEGLCVARDVTDQRTLETRLAQAQKLEAVGHLAAGVAHEINTPMQFIGDNLHFVKQAVGDLVPFIGLLRGLIARAGDARLTTEERQRVATAENDADLEYTMSTLSDVVDRSLAGVERVTKIVQAMKAFSHPGEHELNMIDVASLIENASVVATNEWKYVADLVLEIAPDLPPLRCFGGELSQVVLNLIVNAAHAITSVVGTSGQKGTITLRAEQDGKTMVIRVQDTGTGIPEAIRSKVFDPFFTTKEVGKGTGQGLALAHSCVVERHHGTLQFETEVGTGTTFILRLPIDGPPPPTDQP